MLDVSMFDVAVLVEYLKPRRAEFPTIDNVEIVRDYMPPYPGPSSQPTCVVRCGEWFLRHSKGPRQGHSWDMYGDDYLCPELALIALSQAPPPPSYKPYLEFSIPLESKR